jgi:hypothetical protein
VRSPVPDPAPDWPVLRARRPCWAELLKRIFEVDALCCPRCGGFMRVIAFIRDPDVIHARRVAGFLDSSPGRM